MAIMPDDLIDKTPMLRETHSASVRVAREVWIPLQIPSDEVSPIWRYRTRVSLRNGPDFRSR